ncbi:27546_t:CDS:2, partial [Gigaspora margarita]
HIPEEEIGENKKIKYEEETFASDEVSEYSNTENISLPSEESSVEETKILSNTNYISLETSLVNTMEVSIDYKESDMDSIYKIMNNKQLPDNTEASIDSYESDKTNVEDSTNDVLEDMSSEFKGDFLTYYKQALLVMCRICEVLKVDRVLLHDDLPNIHPTNNHHIRGNSKELWLIEGELILINPTNIENFLQDIKHLESGLIMKTLISNAWIMGEIGYITADLLQRNDLADVKQHSANHNVKHLFFQDFCNVYTNYLNSGATLINKRLEFYNSITYTIFESNQNSIQINFKVGDFVDLLKETEGIAFARIVLIFWYQANNDQYYAFFLFNWLQATNNLDSVLGCPIYHIQKPEESCW